VPVLRLPVREEPELLLEEATAILLRAREVAARQEWVGERTLDCITIGDINANWMICRTDCCH
jgi:hypothetical protein